MYIVHFMKALHILYANSGEQKRSRSVFRAKYGRRPPLKLKVNQGVAVQNPQKTL